MFCLAGDCSGHGQCTVSASTPAMLLPRRRHLDTTGGPLAPMLSDGASTSHAPEMSLT